MKNILQKISMAIVPLFILIWAAPVGAAVDCNAANLSTAEAIQCGVNGAAGNNQTPDQAASNIQSTVTQAINIISLLVGAVAVVMLIIGGFRFVSSSGNQESVAGARRTITYAVIGLIVAAVAQIVVHFVLENVTKSDTGTISSSSSASGGSGSAATKGSGGVAP